MHSTFGKVGFIASFSGENSRWYSTANLKYHLLISANRPFRAGGKSPHYRFHPRKFPHTGNSTQNHEKSPTRKIPPTENSPVKSSPYGKYPTGKLKSSQNPKRCAIFPSGPNLTGMLRIFHLIVTIESVGRTCAVFLKSYTPDRAPSFRPTCFRPTFFVQSISSNPIRLG